MTVTVNCQPSGSATSCPGTFTLYADQLGPTAVVPTLPNGQPMAQIKRSVPPGEQQTVSLNFVLTHKALNLLYAKPDPRCYVEAVITPSQTSNQAQIYKSADVFIK